MQQFLERLAMGLDPWSGKRTRREALVTSLAWLGTGGAVLAAPRRSSNTSDRQHQEALSQIPFKQLTPQAQQVVMDVVKSPSLFRRIPRHQVDCHPDLFLCLVRNPEVVVSIWRQMGSTNIQLQRTGPFTFDASDGAGTTGRLELLYGTPQLHVLLASGAYEGPLLKRKIPGKCVLVLKTNYQEKNKQRFLVTSSLDVFLSLQNVGADAVVRTLQPLVGKTADANFTQSANFVGKISDAAERNQDKLQGLIERLQDLQPKVKKQFSQVAAAVHKDMQERYGMNDRGSGAITRSISSSQSASNAASSAASSGGSDGESSAAVSVTTDSAASTSGEGSNSLGPLSLPRSNPSLSNNQSSRRKPMLRR